MPLLQNRSNTGFVLNCCEYKIVAKQVRIGKFNVTDMELYWNVFHGFTEQVYNKMQLLTGKIQPLYNSKLKIACRGTRNILKNVVANCCDIKDTKKN